MKIATVCSAQLAWALALTALLASETNASKKFVKMIPNGGNVPDTPAIGHPDGTGKSAATNAFGDEFSAAGNKWTKELCEADTDGDGQTNGQELGDPCCEWDMDTNPVVQWTDGVSHPDDASKTSDPSLWANLCGASTAETTSTTETEASTTSTESSGGDNGSGTAAASAEATEASESTTSSSSSTSTLSSSGSSSDSSDGDSYSDEMHIDSHSTESSNSSAFDTGSMSTSGSSSSAVEVGSPSSSSSSSKSTMRGVSSESSGDSSASTPSTSSSSSATSGASVAKPIFMTAGVIAAAVAFFA